jgi:hypothetical protein
MWAKLRRAAVAIIAVEMRTVEMMAVIPEEVILNNDSFGGEDLHYHVRMTYITM